MRQASLPSDETRWRARTYQRQPLSKTCVGAGELLCVAGVQNVLETRSQTRSYLPVRWHLKKCSKHFPPQKSSSIPAEHTRAVRKLSGHVIATTEALVLGLFSWQPLYLGGSQKQATTLGKMCQRKWGPWCKKKLENLYWSAVTGTL